MRERVVAFIDGFNAYHSVHELSPEQNHLKWLDLESLVSAPKPYSAPENFLGCYAACRRVRFVTLQGKISVCNRTKDKMLRRKPKQFAKHLGVSDSH